MTKTHGMSGTRTYSIWQNMRARCEMSHIPQYADYGAKGIKVCPSWLDFSVFLFEMGEAPEGHSLDRIDYTGNYDQFNCRWATTKEQTRNMSRNLPVTLRGKTMVLTDWCAFFGLKKGNVWSRMKRRKLSPHDALMTYAAASEYAYPGRCMSCGHVRAAFENGPTE